MKRILLSLILFLLFIPNVYAEYMLFVSDTCAHCNNLKEELIDKNYYEKFNINEYEISDFMELYIEKSKEVNYKNGRVPLMIYNGEYYEGQNTLYQLLILETVDLK